MKANKKLGQHFLTDQDMIDRIVRAIHPLPEQNLLEIGPGLGAITLDVLKQCEKLTVIELDRRVIPILKASSERYGELNIINQDVLAVNYASLLGDQSWRVFGNLPYNISTPILFTLSEHARITDMVFMLQKEVIDRMSANVGEKAYGRLAIMLQQLYVVEPLFDVPPESFSPPPKVMSGMVALFRRDVPQWQVNDVKTFSHVVKQAFGMRRKTLRNNFKGILSVDDIEALDIDPSARAETLTGEAFAKISNDIFRKTEG